MGKIISKINNISHKGYQHIPQNLINDSISKISLVDLISQTVTLSQVSKEQWKGLCPFHNEKTPSFFVNELKCFYHCFGCGESGNAISFLMKIYGMDFRQAAMRVFQLAGIEFFDQEKIFNGESSIYLKSVENTIKNKIEGKDDDIIEIIWNISDVCFNVVKNKPESFDTIEEIYLNVDDNYRFKNYDRIKYIHKNLSEIIKGKINSDIKN